MSGAWLYRRCWAGPELAGRYMVVTYLIHLAVVGATSRRTDEGRSSALDQVSGRRELADPRRGGGPGGAGYQWRVDRRDCARTLIPLGSAGRSI